MLSITLVVGSLLAAFAVLLLLRFGQLGFYAAACLVLLDALWEASPPAIAIYSVNLYPLDVLSGLLIMATTIRLATGRIASTPPLAMLFALLASVLVLTVIGMAEYGFAQAGNGARPYVYFLTAAVYAASLGGTVFPFERFAQLWIRLALVLLILALGRWLLVALGFAHSEAWRSPGGEVVRVLNAAQTFVLLQALALSWFARRHGWAVPLRRHLPIFLLLSVLMLQHRAVWAALVAVVLILFLKEQELRSRILRATVLVTVIGLVLGSGTLGDQILGSLRASARQLDTLAWRVEGWSVLLDPSNGRSSLSYVWGQPMGTGYYRELTQGVVEVSPHNYYVQVFYDTGLIGIGLLFGTYALLMSTFRHAHRNSGPCRAMLVLLIAHLVYFVPYSPGFEQGIILGIGVALHRMAWRNTAHRAKRTGELRAPYRGTHDRIQSQATYPGSH